MLACAVLCGTAAGDLHAQKSKKPGSDDDGYIPVVAPENSKKKKKNEDLTQTLPPATELPLALQAEAGRLEFAVSPLASKGLLTQQTRSALNALLHRNHGTIIKLRAFVAGSGDLRRIGELVGEIFTEKHEPLPVLTVVQVGALPMQAQVVIESTEVDRRQVNPDGVVFLSAQPAAGVAQSLERLKTELAAADPAATPEDVLRVTCFVSGLDQEGAGDASSLASFSKAAVNYLQMEREPVRPAAQCEMVARLRSARAARAPDRGTAAHMAVEPGTKLVITGTQLAFGAQESDLKLAFERLDKALSASDSRLDDAVMAHLYVTPGSAAAHNAVVQAQVAKQPSALVPVEALPSLDASFGVDVIAVAGR